MIVDWHPIFTRIFFAGRSAWKLSADPRMRYHLPGTLFIVVESVAAKNRAVSRNRQPTGLDVCDCPPSKYALDRHYLQALPSG
jgi:hypothetical protein